MVGTPKGSAHPSSSSSSYACATDNLLLPSMLSELAFDKEHEPVQSPLPILGSPKSPYDPNTSRAATTATTTTTASSWSGLFCFSFLDPDDDMFYDAQEIHMEYDRDGRHILTPEEQQLLRSLRGGGYHYPTDNPTPNNLGSRRDGRRISLSDSANNGNSSYSNLIIHPYPTASYSTTGTSSPSASKQKLGLGQIPTATTTSLSVSASSSSQELPSPSNNQQQKPHELQKFGGIPAPPAPEELPLRFLRAGKGDAEEGQRRYEATLEWRKEHKIDNILLEAHPNFELIKQHYPHYYHLRGHNGEPVFFEQPPKTNLAALRAGGIDLQTLVRHYVMVTEFGWQFVEPDDFARSITVLDLEGMGMRDFVGECVEYVKMCSTFTGQHYPERAGHVLVINCPRWFSMVWNVVKPMVDEVTLKKISIVRGKQEVFDALAAKIPVENIPPEYGGKSMPLGKSPEEEDLRALMAHNNALAQGDYSCGGCQNNCRFCSWGPARCY